MATITEHDIQLRPVQARDLAAKLNEVADQANNCRVDGTFRVHFDAYHVSKDTMDRLSITIEAEPQDRMQEEQRRFIKTMLAEERFTEGDLCLYNEGFFLNPDAHRTWIGWCCALGI